VYRNLTVTLCSLFVVSMSGGYAQQLRVLSAATVSSDGDPHRSYSVEADPDNPNNLISCGIEWNAQDNANYGFVYSSQDAGKTWRLSLEDKNSKWVSEESCAFGVHGVAYFVADASKVVGGDAQHEHGTTRIWVSRDSGRSWSVGATAGWTDCSSSIVDRNPGPNQNRLYIFFNSLWIYYASVGDEQALQRIKDQFIGGNMYNQNSGLISYKDGEREVSGPMFDPEMNRQQFDGTYIRQSLMLRDGSLLTFFWSKGSKETGRGFILATQRTDPKRQELNKAVTYTDPRLTEKARGYTDSPRRTKVRPSSCLFNQLGVGAAYDAANNTVYATYPASTEGNCKLMIAKSTDNGLTWSAGHPWIEKQDEEANVEEVFPHPYSSFAMARNQEGVIALLWRNSYTSNCWYFAASTDDGQTYSHPMQLSSCSTETGNEHYLSDASLGFHQNQPDDGKFDDTASVYVMHDMNLDASHGSGIAVSPDGVFHPVWTILTSDEGQLRTAAIAVIKPRDRDNPESARADGWRLRTNKVQVLYGGSQHYDKTTGVLMESVILRNSGTETLRAPLRLEIDVRSQIGLVYPLDLLTEESGQSVTQYLDIDQYIPGDGLTQGASSAPIPLKFHFEPHDSATAENDDLAQISMRLWARGSK
jgi:hypothetical protein